MKQFLLFLWLSALSVLQADFLEPQEAFKPTVRFKAPAQIEVHMALGNNIYLYKDKFKATIASTFAIASIEMPEGELHDEDIVFTASPTIVLNLVRLGETTAEHVALTLSYQGCSAEGLCYQPIEQTFDVVIDPKNVLLKKSLVQVSQTDQIAQAFIEGSTALVILTFFGFGVLLAFTPCVFPMIPILSSIIVSQKGDMNAKRGFILSVVYVLAMATAYSFAGVLAGLFGSNIQVAMQNPWVISTFALLFVGLAMSMFGFFQIGLPASWQIKLSKTSDEASSKGGLLGVAAMGFLSALIVGPCVAPPLAGALVYIGQSGDALLGGAALFVLSLGMGIPLLLVGLGAGKWMPRPGGWMERVTHVFGVMMLAIAIWMLSRILDATLVMFLWAFLAVVSAVYLGALEPLKSRSWDALFKGVGIILLAYGLALFIGALSGGTNPLKPLGFHLATVSNQTPKLAFTTIGSSGELDALLAQHRGKPVMLDFYAKWCTSCNELEETTFADPRVLEALKDYVLIQADVTQNDAEHQALTKRFGLFGPPAILFFDAQGTHTKEAQIIGYIKPEALVAHVSKL